MSNSSKISERRTVPTVKKMIPKEIEFDVYRKMTTIRKFESRIARLLASGELRGAYHLYIGMEAVAVGACSALRQDDYITSTHRGHAHLIAKGGRMERMFAEVYGKADGYNKGKGGSMHIADTEIGMLGANGIVGGGLPMATGAGLSAKFRRTDQVTVCFFGDGAANQGTFLESINIAAAYDLPVIYLCENNLYAVGTRFSEVSKIEDIAKRASGFGIEGKIVDGNDVIAVYDAVNEAVTLARDGKGPTLIECKTYRWCGHAGGAMDTSKEAEAWRKRDPIKLFTAHLIRTGRKKEQLKEIEDNIEKEIDAAVEFAKNSPQTSLAEATTDVYAGSFFHE